LTSGGPVRAKGPPRLPPPRPRAPASRLPPVPGAHVAHRDADTVVVLPPGLAGQPDVVAKVDRRGHVTEVGGRQAPAWRGSRRDGRAGLTGRQQTSSRSGPDALHQGPKRPTSRHRGRLDCPYMTHHSRDSARALFSRGSARVNQRVGADDGGGRHQRCHHSNGGQGRTHDESMPLSRVNPAPGRHGVRTSAVSVG